MSKRAIKPITNRTPRKPRHPAQAAAPAEAAPKTYPVARPDGKVVHVTVPENEREAPASAPAAPAVPKRERRPRPRRERAAALTTAPSETRIAGIEWNARNHATNPLVRSALVIADLEAQLREARETHQRLLDQAGGWNGPTAAAPAKPARPRRERRPRRSQAPRTPDTAIAATAAPPAPPTENASPAAE